MLTKIAVVDFPPTLVAASRLTVACLMLLLIMLIMAHRMPTGRRLWVFYALIAMFGNAMPFLLISWGQAYIDSGPAGILMAVMPLVTLSLAHFLVPGERITPYRIIGFLFGFTGIIVLMGQDALSSMSGDRGQLLPMIAVLGGALCYAISSILARLRPPSEALPSAAATTLVATLMLLPLTFQRDSVFLLAEANNSQLVAVIILGLFSTALAAIVYFKLISSAGPAFTSQLNYLVPLWAVLVGTLVLGETLRLNHLYAMLLIFFGIFVTQLERIHIRVLQQRLIGTSNALVTIFVRR